MANLTVTIPDTVAQRALDAVCSTYGYDSATDGTKLQFAKSVVADFVKDVVRAYEANQAAEACRAAAIAKADSEVSVS